MYEAEKSLTRTLASMVLKSMKHTTFYNGGGLAACHRHKLRREREGKQDIPST